MRAHLALFLLSISSCVIVTKQGDDERRLLRWIYKVKRYQVLERPVEDENSALEVKFGLTLQQIIDVDEKAQVLVTNVWLMEDEKNQIINTNIWLNMQWFDYRLKWDASEYGNISVINLPVKQVWRPDVLMYNSADEKFDATFPTSVVVKNTGSVSWIPPGMFKSTCNINIKWFPFDDQKCELKFGSWTYDGTKLNLTLDKDQGDTSAFIKNGEWTLLDVPALRNEKYYAPSTIPWIDVTFIINIRRRALYYVFNLVVPSVLLFVICFLSFRSSRPAFILFLCVVARRSSVSLLVFTLPVESGEKISLGVTILLSLTVFLLLVAEAMPPTSDAIPLIGLYFACTMLMCSLSVICTVLVLNFHWRRPDTHTMPQWVRRGICQWMAWLLRMERPGQMLTRKEMVATTQLQINEKSSKSLLANVLDMDDDIRCFVEGFNVATKISPDGRSMEVIGKANAKSYGYNGGKFRPRGALAAILRELRTITDKLRDDGEKEGEASDWMFAAMVIDRLCLYVFLLTTLVSTAAIFFSAPNIFA